jgi:hypothetical protein
MWQGCFGGRKQEYHSQESFLKPMPRLAQGEVQQHDQVPVFIMSQELSSYVILSLINSEFFQTDILL